MNPNSFLVTSATIMLSARLLLAADSPPPQLSMEIARKQVPTWSQEDLDFFLHGSMSTEVFPETVVKAFLGTYPELFPGGDLTVFGLVPDPAFGWPIGFSRAPVKHLGGLRSIGINCAACHFTEVRQNGGNQPLPVLGVTSHFDAEAFFGALAIATFKTADPANMKRFLTAWLDANDPLAGEGGRNALSQQWDAQVAKITSIIAGDPAGSRGLAPGQLQEISPSELRFNKEALEKGIDLAALSHSVLKLLHNIRAALHIPDEPPRSAPPASGPGRNDAFGLLSAVLFGAPQPYGPVKYGLVWDLDKRPWVHWDGNTRSPIGRNLLAALGLGAPLIGKHGTLDFALLQRQTTLSETIRPPKYPWAIDKDLAARGAVHYHNDCARCHDGSEDDRRLHDVGEIGTDPQRARLFTQAQADRFNTFLGSLETAGYHPSKTPGLRSSGKYFAASLPGVWARSPYLHNGSVRTMQDLLSPASGRSKTFKRGSRNYDTRQLGYTDEGPYLLDTRTPGNSNSGHEYGLELSTSQKNELIEYLKSL